MQNGRMNEEQEQKIYYHKGKVFTGLIQFDWWVPFFIKDSVV